ncbi:MAG: hypothetical protein K6E96_02815 [Bacteroidales bacterium]|nr:hypothetical protein [Bacteroidales bacterium]
MTACEPETIVPGEPSNPQTTNARVKSTSDLHNTDWTYTTTLSELIANMMPGFDTCYMGGMDDETYVFGLNFDGQYAHFSFPENVMAFGGDEGVMDQITGVSYEYEYDGATHTGHLTVSAEDMDGDETIAPLEFTYDDATDIITFNLNMFYAFDGTPATLTLNFARNE